MSSGISILGSLPMLEAYATTSTGAAAPHQSAARRAWRCVADAGAAPILATDCPRMQAGRVHDVFLGGASRSSSGFVR